MSELLNSYIAEEDLEKFDEFSGIITDIETGPYANPFIKTAVTRPLLSPTHANYNKNINSVSSAFGPLQVTGTTFKNKMRNLKSLGISLTPEEDASMSTLYSAYDKSLSVMKNRLKGQPMTAKEWDTYGAGGGFGISDIDKANIASAQHKMLYAHWLKNGKDGNEAARQWHGGANYDNEAYKKKYPQRYKDTVNYGIKYNNRVIKGGYTYQTLLDKIGADGYIYQENKTTKVNPASGYTPKTIDQMVAGVGEADEVPLWDQFSKNMNETGGEVPQYMDHFEREEAERLYKEKEEAEAKDYSYGGSAYGELALTVVEEALGYPVRAWDAWEGNVSQEFQPSDKALEEIIATHSEEETEYLMKAKSIENYHLRERHVQEGRARAGIMGEAGGLGTGLLIATSLVDPIAIAASIATLGYSRIAQATRVGNIIKSGAIASGEGLAIGMLMKEGNPQMTDEDVMMIVGFSAVIGGGIGVFSRTKAKEAGTQGAIDGASRADEAISDATQKSIDDDVAKGAKVQVPSFLKKHAEQDSDPIVLAREEAHISMKHEELKQRRIVNKNRTKTRLSEIDGAIKSTEKTLKNKKSGLSAEDRATLTTQLEDLRKARDEVVIQGEITNSTITDSVRKLDERTKEIADIRGKKTVIEEIDEDIAIGGTRKAELEETIATLSAKKPKTKDEVKALSLAKKDLKAVNDDLDDLATIREKEIAGEELIIKKKQDESTVLPDFVKERIAKKKEQDAIDATRDKDGMTPEERQKWLDNPEVPAYQRNAWREQQKAEELNDAEVTVNDAEIEKHGAELAQDAEKRRLTTTEKLDVEDQLVQLTDELKALNKGHTAAIDELLEGFEMPKRKLTESKKKFNKRFKEADDTLTAKINAINANHASTENALRAKAEDLQKLMDSSSMSYKALDELESWSRMSKQEKTNHILPLKAKAERNRMKARKEASQKRVAEQEKADKKLADERLAREKADRDAEEIPTEENTKPDAKPKVQEADDEVVIDPDFGRPDAVQPPKKTAPVEESANPPIGTKGGKRFAQVRTAEMARSKLDKPDDWFVLGKTDSDGKETFMLHHKDDPDLFKAQSIEAHTLYDAHLSKAEEFMDDLITNLRMQDSMTQGVDTSEISLDILSKAFSVGRPLSKSELTAIGNRYQTNFDLMDTTSHSSSTIYRQFNDDIKKAFKTKEGKSFLASRKQLLKDQNISELPVKIHKTDANSFSGGKDHPDASNRGAKVDKTKLEEVDEVIEGASAGKIPKNEARSKVDQNKSKSIVTQYNKTMESVLKDAERKGIPKGAIDEYFDYFKQDYRYMVWGQVESLIGKHNIQGGAFNRWHKKNMDKLDELEAGIFKKDQAMKELDQDAVTARNYQGELEMSHKNLKDSGADADQLAHFEQIAKEALAKKLTPKQFKKKLEEGNVICDV